MLAAKPAPAQTAPATSAIAPDPGQITPIPQGDAGAAQELDAEQLDQLVAPIALYPDALVAQILVASTFPVQVVQAERWLSANAQLNTDERSRAVDAQDWDPSVKALTAFPTVLGNMDANLAWTSALGDAYYLQPKDVMDSIQALRQSAQRAGSLTSTREQTVSAQNGTIFIAPANPQVVYVPAYNPWLVYGYRMNAWPGWYAYPSIWYSGPYVSFGAGFSVGYSRTYGWGWSNWGYSWRNNVAVYRHGAYPPRSPSHGYGYHAVRRSGSSDHHGAAYRSASHPGWSSPARHQSGTEHHAARPPQRDWTSGPMQRGMPQVGQQRQGDLRHAGGAARTPVPSNHRSGSGSVHRSSSGGEHHHNSSSVHRSSSGSVHRSSSGGGRGMSGGGGQGFRGANGFGAGRTVGGAHGFGGNRSFGGAHSGGGSGHHR